MRPSTDYPSKNISRMNLRSFCITSLIIFPFLAKAAEINEEEKRSFTTSQEPNAVTIAVTELKINDKALKLSYDIKNDSKDDTWIRVDKIQLSSFSPQIFGFQMHVDVSIAENGQTLMIGKRILARPMYSAAYALEGKYVRLRSGESQTESIFIKIPVSEYSTEYASQQEHGLKHAKRLAIELGYYKGNLPERVFKKLKSLENASPESSILPFGFSRSQESVISRDEEIWISQEIPGVPGFNETELVLMTVVDNLQIPYEWKQYSLLYEEKENPPVRSEAPDLASCTKIEIRYQPSMLEYLFPYAFQQNLMSPGEKKYLQSRTLVVDNPQDIKTIAHSFSKAVTVDIGVVVRYRSYFDVVCSYDGKPSMSFPIYDDYAIIDKGDRLICLIGFPSLTMLIPHIHEFDLRIQCAANLKNQWYRFRFYNLHEALRRNDPSIRNKTIYPIPSEWCDDMLRPYTTSDGFTSIKRDNKPHICPSARGKNDYAMNPNCKPDSLLNTVLLFETKAGWNQHGGPELFTFDNHDPKGGCVLLNDGTVKFIHTKEELQQLRWK